MNPIEIIFVIARMKKKKEKYVPITEHSLKDVNLIPHHITRNQEGNPIFFFVDRLEYINALEIRYSLIKKRQSLKDVLRASLRK